MRSLMKLVLAVFGGLFLLAAVCAGLAAWGWQAYRAPGPLPEHRDVLIGRGAGLSGIAAQLEREGIVSSRFVFIAAARLSGRARALQAGEYDFPAGVTVERALSMIASGDVVMRKVTVPEGLTSWQVVKLLEGTEGLSGRIEAVPPEGGLLPQTYTFLRGEDRNALVARMQEAMRETLDELWWKRDPATPVLSPAEAVILASIVEKETGVAAERQRVAGVFANRLRRGIPLQSDPTVIYALTEGRIESGGMGPLGRRLLTRDLETASPYNTYRNAGLPPGPIANPGRESIEAALHPEPHDFLYFVASGGGGHVFAATLAEHNRNVAAWRQARKAADR